ncbi:MAG: hypothetical protein VB031_02320 [Eubacteriaceae bacterium]|nr:hypothetical protein [Eubacteriaceae bacterium]
MTPEERDEIISELERIYTEKSIAEKQNVQTVLAAPRNKWFRDAADSNHYHHSLMTEVVGDGATAWRAWEFIRRLTCIVCGEKYVRRLGGCAEEAEEAAEILCQTFYDLAKAHQEKGNSVDL